MARLLKDAWLPANANVKRVVSHWTGGGYNLHESELEPYHFVIDGAGVVHKGDPDVGEPGAHTRMFNTGSVGVSICSMHNAKEGGPYGPAPLKESQWEISAQVTAELCFRYELPVTPRTVLQHGEVRKRFPEIFTGTTWNKGKWDCNELPFATELSDAEVQEDYRDRVRKHLKALQATKVKPIPVTVNGMALVDSAGKPIGFFDDSDDRAWIWVRPLLAPMQIELLDVESTSMDLKRSGQQIKARARIEEGRGYVAAGELRKFAGVVVNGDGTFVGITA